MNLKQLLALVIVFALATSAAVSCVNGEDFGTDYNKAVKASQADGKQLVIMVGADWCLPCRQAKFELRQNMFFAKDYHFVYVDYDSPLGRRLASPVGGIPQFHRYSNGIRNGLRFGKPNPDEFNNWAVSKPLLVPNGTQLWPLKPNYRHRSRIWRGF